MPGAHSTALALVLLYVAWAFDKYESVESIADSIVDLSLPDLGEQHATSQDPASAGQAGEHVKGRAEGCDALEKAPAVKPEWQVPRRRALLAPESLPPD